MTFRCFCTVLLACMALTPVGHVLANDGEGSAEPPLAAGSALRAGAHAVDITPVSLPVIVNGGFLQQQAGAIHSRLYARCLVLDDGQTRLAIAVVDSCILPRDLLDEAKEQAARATGIPVDRMLISATHTHSAPSVAGALGTGVDEAYAAWLPGKLAEGIVLAARNLVPAEAGWGVVQSFEHTHCRRWILRPDRLGIDPFGLPTVRAMMHPGYQNPDYIGPAGPVDPDLSLLSIRTADSRPLALLANYSMHYFRAPAVSADYFGVFADKLERLMVEEGAPPFVGMMSQGTSGDLHWMDYSQPQRQVSIEQYAGELAALAHQVYRGIEHRRDVPLAMREKRLTLRRRLPDEDRLAWARQMVEQMGERLPANRPEVYAREQWMLLDEPVRELKLQALRVGELGITAIPCEVYGLTGLKIKAQSPLAHTFNISLANGGEGYIPPPEQHTLGGYTTWPARTAGLEDQAEPLIVDAVLDLLAEVAGKPRREVAVTHGAYAQAVLASRPLAYWRMEEPGGSRAIDATGNGHHAMYGEGVALYLEGPDSGSFSGTGIINRAPHLAGGQMTADVPAVAGSYSMAMWFWNGMPADARPITGHLFSVVPPGEGGSGEHLAISGTGSGDLEQFPAGRLMFYRGDAPGRALAGSAEIPLKTWHFVVLTRDDRAINVFLDGRLEITGPVASPPPAGRRLSIGGRSNPNATFEGRIDEVAFWNRALCQEEVAGIHEIAQMNN